MADVTTCITVPWHRRGGIENENEAEDWAFRTVSCCSGVEYTVLLCVALSLTLCVCGTMYNICLILPWVALSFILYVALPMCGVFLEVS